MNKRLVDAEARLRRCQAAITAGVDPNALIEVINAARAERRAAQAEIDNTSAPDDSLGNVPAEVSMRVNRVRVPPPGCSARPLGGDSGRQRKGDADALRGVERLAEALVPWLGYPAS